MENRTIQDGQLTASTTFHMHAAKDARLNEKKEGGSTGAWCAFAKTTGDYFQVDLLNTAYITKIATQSRPKEYYNGMLLNHWITQYSLAHSNDGSSWINYGIECNKVWLEWATCTKRSRDQTMQLDTAGNEFQLFQFISKLVILQNFSF